MMYIAIVIVLLVIFLLIIFYHEQNSCCINRNLCNKIDTYLKESQKNPNARSDPTGVIGMAKWNYILAPELYEKIEQGALSGPNAPILLDIRRPEDYAKGHIPGAINIFWLDLMENDNICKLARLTDNMKKPIIVICYVGHTSSQMLVLLRLLGFNAISLKYGMGISPVSDIPRKGWLDYGFPVEKTQK